jgi:AraC family transcriptional regulator
VSLTKRAIWVIERHLDGGLGLSELADACGVSPCHLSHAFTERVGRPVTDYIRARRLTLAADALARGAKDILGGGLASGYGSHEAFARAFKAMFGVTPESVRRRGDASGLPLVGALNMLVDSPSEPLIPTFRQLEAGTYACLEQRFAFHSMQEIPALWRRFASIHPVIRGKLTPVPVSIMGAIAEDGWFDYACAVKVRPTAALPKELKKREVPAHRYAVFAHAGHISEILGTYREIWNRTLVDCGLTMADRLGFEFHNPEFDPATGEGGVTIWIPIASEF